MFDAVILPDETLDETPDGYGVALFPFGLEEREKPEEVSVRFSVTAKIRPLSFVRSGGKWFMQFDVVNPCQGGEVNYAVECGEAPAPFTFAEAARVLFGA